MMKKLRCITLLSAGCFLLSCNGGASNTNETPGVDSAVTYGVRSDTIVETVGDSLSTTAGGREQIRLKETCDEPSGDMENGFTTVCFLWNADLQTAYDYFRHKNGDNDDGRFLAAVMPAEAEHTDTGTYPMEIKYQRKSDSRLTVDLTFPGGETQLVFEKKEKGVEIRTLHSPD